MKTKIIIVLLLVFSGISVAQPFGGRHQKGPKERIEELARIKLLEILNLNEEDAIRFFSRRNNYLDGQKELTDQRDEVMLEMEIAIRKEKTNDEFDYKAAIKKIANLEDQISEQREKFINSLSDLLSIEQIAKLIVFESKFRREIRDVLMQRRGGN